MFWSDECSEVCRSAGDGLRFEKIKSHRELLYCDSAFCWFEKPLLQVATRLGYFPLVACTWLWATFPNRNGNKGIHFSGLCKNQEFVTPTIWGTAWEAEPLSLIHNPKNFTVGKADTETVSELDRLLRFIITSGTFLRQKLLVETKERAERHLRKRIAKLGYSPDRLISIINLRKREYKQGDQHEECAVDPVNWSHKWIVRGHMRQQWYPSLHANLPVWIHPYIKGPENMPLKPRSTPIFAVIN